MDFYNTAYANEGDFSTNSNTVHVYMGKEEDEITMYTVTYQYSGNPPDNAPPLPAVSSYAPGTTVGVLTDPQVEGYTFSGWTSSNVVVNGGKFTMPTANVVLQGNFTKNATYEVEYKLKSDTPQPDGYTLPKTREYGAGDDVVIDTLKENDEVNGYRFKGWKVESGGVEISDGGFEMPKNKVVLVGEFERISYKVSYQFQGAVLPSNWQSLLPGEKTYYPGDTVTVENDPVASGFQFLGWYYDKSFTMPSEDVVIIGEWMRLSGKFSPTIEKTLDNSKSYYHKGEVVNFNIKVSNNESYPIIDVMLQENLDGASFVDGTGYTVLNEHYVKINRIDAKSNVVVKAKYTAGDDVAKTIVNEVVLAGALSDPDSGDYVLDSSEEHKAEVSFNVSNISLAINKVNSKSEALSGAEFTLYSDSGLETVVGKGLKFDNLNFNTTYYLKETKAPTGYVILEKAIPVRIDSSGNISMEDYDVDNKSGTGTVQIINNPVNMLPNTGGIGNIPFVVGGVVIMLVASVGCGYYIIRVRKGKKK